MPSFTGLIKKYFSKKEKEKLPKRQFSAAQNLGFGQTAGSIQKGLRGGKSPKDVGFRPSGKGSSLQDKYAKIKSNMASERGALNRPLAQPEKSGYHFTPNKAGGMDVFNSLTGQTISLTKAQYKDYIASRGSSQPLVSSGRDEISAYNKALEGQYLTQLNRRAQLRTTPEEQLVFPELQQVPERSIASSTLRESAPKAAATALAATGGVALMTGAGSNPLSWIASGATFAGVFGMQMFSNYKANHQEEVSNAWQGFRGIKSGVTMIPTTLRTGGISPAQAQVYYVYAEAEVNAMEARLVEKFDTKFVADIADADGKLRYLREYKELYMPLIKAQLDMAMADPNYIPQDVIIPDYEGEMA